jgi:hypothetical protein
MRGWVCNIFLQVPLGLASAPTSTLTGLYNSVVDQTENNTSPTGVLFTMQYPSNGEALVIGPRDEPKEETRFPM